MPRLHGKNAEMRVSVGETVETALALVQVGATRVYQAPVGDRDWKYGTLTRVEIVHTEGVIPTPLELDPDGPYVNLAAGAIVIPPELLLTEVTSVDVDVTTMDLVTISAKTKCTRQFTLRLEAEIVDATCIGDRFKAKVSGIPDWKGTLAGLYVDAERWENVIGDVNGEIPRFIMRFKPDPSVDTYYQGTVIFPGKEFTAGFDAIIEDNHDFEGDGPINAIADGAPLWPQGVETAGP